MQPENSAVVIAAISRNASEEIRVSLSTYRGGHYLDLRNFAAFGDTPERKPTKKGVTLRIEKIDELMAVLVHARAEAIRQGSLVPRT